MSYAMCRALKHARNQIGDIHLARPIASQFVAEKLLDASSIILSEVIE